MNRALFILTLCFINYSLFTQNQIVKIPPNLSKQAKEFPKQILNPENKYLNEKIIGEKDFADITGLTYYDLQTYNSLQQRIYAYPNETIGLTWMMGFNVGTWDDRGTGYNYFNGQEWDPSPTITVENEETGWPCYAPYGENGEIVVSFYFDDPYWALMISTRENRGTGEWNKTYLPGPNNIGIAWPALITNGYQNSIIHILARTVGSEYMGQAGALLYYRSSDGGETWEIEHHFFEDLGANHFNGIPGDCYSWASPRGDTIAFSVGFNTADGYVMKSFDNGNSWDKIEVYESPYSPYTGGSTPWFAAGDYTSSVALDSEGMVHVAFGRMLWYYDGNEILHYNPYSQGLIYWNEDMDPLDTTIMSSYTLDYLIYEGNLVGWVVPYNADTTITGLIEYYVSMTSYPQINIDEFDRIFLTYSGVAAGIDNGDYNFRHVYGTASTDGGYNWSEIVDLNLSDDFLYYECVYPFMSPTFAGNKIHLAFQKDDQPGLHVWMNAHSVNSNEIIYLPIDIEVLTATDEILPEHRNDVLKNFPNPFNESTSLEIYLNTAESISLTIYNAAGILVRKMDNIEANPGKNYLEIKRERLKAGIYFYSVLIKNKILGGKMIIVD